MIFPKNCVGCGRSLGRGEDILCTICKYELPKTSLLKQVNAFETKFHGRISIKSALAFLHFHKEGMVQSILHNFKYRDQPEIGLAIGEWFGKDLVEADLANEWDLVIPVPLHRSREKRRGYNQSNHFAQGLGAALDLPVALDAVIRKKRSESQTHKSRQERWENVEGIFEVRKPELVQGKHVVLVDDVVTTGATLESCGHALLQAGAKDLSFATLAIAH